MERCSVWSSCTVQTNLFGYGRRILAKIFGYASKRTLLRQLLFNINSVRVGKVFAVTFYLVAYKCLLSDKQITLYRLHVRKDVCKSNFWFDQKSVEIQISHYAAPPRAGLFMPKSSQYFGTAFDLTCYYQRYSVVVKTDYTDYIDDERSETAA